jgi:hypothetical protein
MDIINQLRNCQLIKKVSAPWSQFKSIEQCFNLASTLESTVVTMYTTCFNI